MFSHTTDWYSAFVNWAKAALYIGALVLLSTLFLFSNKVRITDPLIYSDMNINDMIQQQRISNPRFTTHTDEGLNIFMSASYARDVENSDVFTAKDIFIKIGDPDDRQTTLSATMATITPTKNQAFLDGQVSIYQSNGISIQAQDTLINLSTSGFHSDNPVHASSAFGTFTAGSIQGQLSETGYKITFTDGVNLVYTKDE